MKIFRICQGVSLEILLKEGRLAVDVFTPPHPDTG